MSASYAVYTADGVSGDFAVPFEYFDVSHLEVRVDNVIVSFTPLTPNLISITPTPSSGQYVTVRRATPPDYTVSPTSFLTLLRYLSEENYDMVYNYAALYGDIYYDITSSASYLLGAPAIFGVIRPSLNLTPSLVGSSVALATPAVGEVVFEVTYDNGTDPEATLATCTVPDGASSAPVVPVVTDVMPSETVYRFKEVSGTYDLATILIRFVRN